MTLLKPIQSFKVVFGLYLAYLIHITQSYVDVCTDIDYTPTNGYRSPPYVEGQYFGDHAVIRYGCDENYVLNGSVQTCLMTSSGSLEWQPTLPPSCTISICEAPVSYPGMTYSPRADVYPIFDEVIYKCVNSENTAMSKCLDAGVWSEINLDCRIKESCKKPRSPENGAVLCCGGESAAKGFCCESGHYAQFTCKDGYVLESSSQPNWKCYDGEWFDRKDNTLNDQLYYPNCVAEKSGLQPDSAGPTELTTGMLTSIVGVAVGVLTLLLLVILLAFCKPRLKDIKRRWRDMREDESRLVINGQEVILPSYDEAILPEQQEQRWMEPSLPASCMLNSLSRPDFNTLTEAAQQQPFLQPQQNITSPPVSNLHHTATVDDQQPCCSRSLQTLDISFSIADPQSSNLLPSNDDGANRPNSLTSSMTTDNVGGGGENPDDDNFHSLLLPSSSQAPHTGSVPQPGLKNLFLDCSKLEPDLTLGKTTKDTVEENPIPQVPQNCSSSQLLDNFDEDACSTTAQDVSVLDNSAINSSVFTDDSLLNDTATSAHTGFEDNFVEATNSIHHLPPSSPADKAVQKNISFFSVMAPDIQVDATTTATGMKVSEGGVGDAAASDESLQTLQSSKPETKWTRF